MARSLPLAKFEGQAPQREMPRVNLDNGVAQAYASMAQNFASLTSTLGKMADRAMVAETSEAARAYASGIGLPPPKLPPYDAATGFGEPPSGPIMGERPGGESTESAMGRRGIKPVAPGPQAQAGGRSARMAQAMAFFRSRGWSQMQAAAIVGQIGAESGFREDVIAGQVKGDQGRSGYAGQWLGERLTGPKGYLAFAKAHGANPGDYGTQLAFYDWELKNTEGRAGNRLKAAMSLEAANDAAIGYERPAGWSLANPRGGMHWDKRLAIAREAFGLSGAPIPPAGGAPSATASVATAPAQVTVTPAGGVADVGSDRVDLSGAEVRRDIPPSSGSDATEGQAPAQDMQQLVLMRGWGLRSQTWNEVALRTAADRMDTQFSQAVYEINTRYANEPEKIGPAIKDYASQVRSVVASDPVLAAGFDEKVRTSILEGERAASVQFMKRQADDREAAFLQNYTSRMSEMSRFATGIGDDKAAQEALAGRMLQMEAWITQQVDFTPKERQKFMMDMYQTVGSAQILGKFDRLTSPEQKEQFMLDFDSAYISGHAATKGFSQDTYERIHNKMEADIKRYDKQREQQAKRISAQVTKVTNQIVKGVPMSNEAMEDLRAKVRTSGDPGLADQWQTVERFMSWMDQNRGNTQAQIQRSIELQRGLVNSHKGSVEDQEKLEMMEKFATTMKEALDEDQLNWALVTGNLPGGLAPITDMSARAADAERVATHYGRKPVYFTRSEAMGMQAMFTTNPDEVVSFGVSLGDTLLADERYGPERLQAAAAQLDKEGAGVLANVIAISADNREDRLLRDYAAYNKRRQIDGYKPIEISEGKWRGYVNDTLGASFNVGPAAKQNVMETAKMLVDLRAGAEGINPSDPTYESRLQDIAKGALLDAAGQSLKGTGGVVDLNGVKTLVMPGMTGDDLVKSWGALSETDLKRLPPIAPNENGLPVTAADLRQGYLMAAGNGKYFVGQGAAWEENFFYGTDNEPWVITADQLETLTRDRRLREQHELRAKSMRPRNQRFPYGR